MSLSKVFIFSDIYNKKCTTVYKDDRTRSVQTGKIRWSRNFLHSQNGVSRGFGRKLMDANVSANSPCTNKRIIFSSNRHSTIIGVSTPVNTIIQICTLFKSSKMSQLRKRIVHIWPLFYKCNHPGCVMVSVLGSNAVDRWFGTIYNW